MGKVLMTLDERTNKTMDVLAQAFEPLTARQIAEKYMQNPTASDALTTGTICNVLAAAGMVRKSTKPRGRRSYFVTFQKV